MRTARLLQTAALGVLWLQLLLHQQLQAWLLPLLMVQIVLALRQAPPPRLVLHGLTTGCLALGLAGASLADRTAVLQSGCTLLWLLCGIKLLEARQPQEQQRSGLLLLIGIGLAGITAQGLGASLLQAAAALLAMASLLSLHGETQALRSALRRSVALCALALPLLATTFVLLPRLEPLWSVAASQARSGLSERLAPGELAALVADDGLAARLSMAPALLPPPEQRYWRVLVHRSFDGEQWQAGEPARPLAELRPMQGTTPSQQRWMVEPNGLQQRPWSGRGQPRGSATLQVTSTGTLIGRTALEERTLYDLNGTEAAGAWQQLPPTAADLQLPAAANPRLRALGEQWQRQGGSATQRLQLARRWFLQQGFRYTLEPGALGTINPLDGFLFETRAGFCEHFAASFSALMRAAGVPSRVVVGYQGGRWQQPIGSPGYLELRNSDAHAWSEVWLGSSGWVRVDPTAWVVPERVRRSLAASLSAADRASLGVTLPRWLEGLSLQWRSLDYRWQLWVMGFDRQRQRSLLGEGPWQGLIALGAMAVALTAGLAPLLLQGRERDPVKARLQRLLRQLARRGLPLLPGESLSPYCRRIAQQQPALQDDLHTIGLLYDSWRFGPQPPSREQRRALLAALSRIRLPEQA